MNDAVHAATFPERAHAGIGNPVLRGALGRMQRDTRASRVRIAQELPEFEALRDAATAIRGAALDNLEQNLATFEANVTALGGTVHWCATAADARQTILDILRGRGARRLAKGKSMVSEEIALNPFLAANGIEVIETDLGEYILQLRAEPPSHIVMPAIHLTKGEVGATFRAAHTALDPKRPLDEPREMLDEARALLRQRFLGAEAGLTGANFLIAETGSALIVTNEGNGDLSQTLPPVHIVLAGIEKVVPSLADAMTLVRVLARSATGQDITAYTTLATGPKRAGDPDGPEEFHVVLLDNGRTKLLDSEFRPVLRCIRCGACQSVCPVYGAVGGHAYGAVYGGPIGAVLMPALADSADMRHLPEASSFCGACEAVCPVRIPLPDLMRRWRTRNFAAAPATKPAKLALVAWGFFARRPALYGAVARIGARLLRARIVPFAASWTRFRDLPVPEGETFIAAWNKRR
jgi:L-lactate dehydrogenase complex protein LldF